MNYAYIHDIEDKPSKSLGFIIIRHVKSQMHDQYWKKSYKNIRNIYKDNAIIIIDDNSDNRFIDVDFQSKLENCTIVQGEYSGRGELLPYCYFLKNPQFDIAVCLHDSVFINKKIDIDLENFNTCSFIWEFEHTWDSPEKEREIMKCLKNSDELIEFHKNVQKWKGCFGAMSIIHHDFLKKIDELYDIERLLEHIKTRQDRMYFERIFACMISKNISIPDTPGTRSLLGNIHKYCKWGVTFIESNRYLHLPMTKVWSGR